MLALKNIGSRRIPPAGKARVALRGHQDTAAAIGWCGRSSSRCGRTLAVSAASPRRAGMLAGCGFAALLMVPAWAEADPLTIGAFGQLARECAPSAAPATLASIARTESAFEPFSIHDNTTGTSVTPASRASATQTAARLLAAGHSVDIGLMQINAHNFGSLGLTLEAAFDPCRSIAAAATILARDYAGGESHADQQAALRVALSKYNTGDAENGFANGYVHKVERAALQVIPALDVAMPATISAGEARTAAAQTDPNAPPSWDVWAAYAYAAARSDAGPLAAVTPAAAAQGPAAAMPPSGPSVER
jgi:type IV secretion system protein VirB1